MKTLAAILHFNTPELTGVLYEQLKPYERDDYDLIILDNGSESGKSIKTPFRLEENVYFGGAVNVLFDYMLDHPEYDSLLILNSDLIVHGYNFIKTMRKHLDEYTVISPAIIQPMRDQCHWKNMHNWNSETIRQVKWCDYQAPLIHRRFIEHVKQFDNMLIYGWGQDILTGIICEEQGWKVGVCDNVTAVHLNSQTINRNQHIPEMQTYCQLAEVYMFQYFDKENLQKRY